VPRIDRDRLDGIGLQARGLFAVVHGGSRPLMIVRRWDYRTSLSTDRARSTVKQ
jgi:hypothetical protein